MREVFCSILVTKMGSDVSKRGQLCGMYALLGYFYGTFFAHLGEKRQAQEIDF